MRAACSPRDPRTWPDATIVVRGWLADLVVHEITPFAEIARSSERIVCVDSGEFVEGRIVEDKERGWVGGVDWDTQDTLSA